MSNFRLDGKAFFLTYPKCDLERTDALDMLTTRLAGIPISQYCIAREQHQDGSYHLHCLLILERRKNTTNPNYFDLGTFHGNYQSARNRVKVYDYITKSDTECLSNIDAESLRIKTVKREMIGKRIMDGSKLEELVEEYPSLLFGFKRLQEDVKSYQEARVQYPPLPNFLVNGWGLLINTFSKEKRRHWWIFSNSPNRGKTTFARYLQDKFKGYIKSSDFTYWNVSGREKLIILDDYNTAGLRFNSLNQLCDGLYEARVFMGGVVRLSPTLVIVLSNCSIESLYPNMYGLLKARFIEKELL